MSFTTSIAGNAPANTFVYTTTTVSADNISCENLSATNASISVLTTDIFNPVNVNSSYIECNNITVFDTGNFSKINAKQIHISNMSLDGTLGGNTANLVTLNADNAAVDALYINEQSVVLTDKSLIRRDANQVMFIGKNSSTDVTGADFLFRTGEETGAVKLRIPRTSDIVSVIALAVDTTCNAGFGNFSAVNVSDLIVSDTTTLRELEVLDSASIKNLTVVGPNGLIATKAGITNASIINCSITNATIANTISLLNTSNINAKKVNTSNLSAINASIDNAMNVRFGITCGSVNASTTITAPTLNGNISNNLAAGAGINLSTVGGVTTITNTGLVTSPLSVSVINASTISTIKINVSNISASGTINANTLTGNVGGNLVAGTGINLSTNVGTGITTITNTGIITDPLNLSTLNASTINVSLLNAPNIEGFTQSTEYAFRASSTSGAQTLAAGNVIDFNSVQLETPPPVTVSGFVDKGYNTTLKQYIIPTSGIYAFGFNMYYNNANFTLRIGIYKNGVLIASGGNNSSTADSVSTVVDCDVDDYIDIRVVSGSGNTVPSNCSFWGYKLIPANNLITSTTNLSIQNLSVSNDITALNITGNISQNLAAGTGINLSTVGGITTISNTGGSVTDPLNLSTLNGSVVNASTLNVSVLNPGYIEGFTQSTEYAFRSTSDAETTDPIVTIGFVAIPFNEHSAPPPQLPWEPYCVPDISAYDRALYQYTVPVSGIWEFGWQIYVMSPATQSVRLRLIIDGAEALSTGASAGNIESAKFVGYVNAGAVVFIKNTNTSNIQLNLSRKYSFWYGNKLTPANNFITSTTNLSIQNLSVSNDITATKIKATNISATAMTFDTASGDKAITTIGEIDAVKFNASSVYISNDLTLDPGGNIRVQSLVPGNDFFIYTNSGNTFLGNLGTGNLNIGNGFITDDISISPSGVITVDNLTSTNTMTAPSATITNISSTDLTIATSLTGAGNINITGDIQTTGIINGATLTGNIAGNLSAGTGIILSTVAGVTNISNSSPYQLPASRVYARINQNNEAPLSTSLFYYTRFDTLTLDCPHVSFSTPNINTGGANSGFIINTQGTYKITYTQCVHNISYTNRVCWWTRLLLNGTPQFCATFIYTRSDNSQYAQYGSGSTSQILVLEVGDYLQLQTRAAKNSSAFNNDFSGLEGYSGSSFILELLT